MEFNSGFKGLKEAFNLYYFTSTVYKEYNWDWKKFHFEFTLLEGHDCIRRELSEILKTSENVKHIYSHDFIFVVYIELFEKLIGVLNLNIRSSYN